MQRFVLALGLVLALSAPTFAQGTVKNPTKVTFTCSADHALIDGYEVDILKADGGVIQTLSFTGSSKPTASGTSCQVALNVQPVAFGTGYKVQVRAKAGAAYSNNVASSNSFDRSPLDVSGVLLAQ